MAEANEYEHWSDDSSDSGAASTVVSGHNASNGSHKWTYKPTDSPQKDARPAKTKPAEPKPAKVKSEPMQPIAVPPQPQQPFQQSTYYMVAPPQLQYAFNPYYQPYAYPAPAYYGLAQPGVPLVSPDNAWTYQPVSTPVEEEAAQPKKKKAKHGVHAWQGRTKAEVEEDNMKIAMREGVYDERKVEPLGLKADQMVWCVEVDGTHTMR